MKSKALDLTALILVIIGAINWGLVGLLNVDLVAVIFGTIPLLQTIVYIVVGIAGVYTIKMAWDMSK